jgi:hypothetical protein
MPNWDVSSDGLALLRAMAGDRADHYVSEILLPSLMKASRSQSSAARDVREQLSNPYRCLEAIYSHYAFSRRGKDKHELAELAVDALRRTCREQAFETFLQQPDATLLWDVYVEVCQERRRKPMEQLNRGVLSGIAELAQEVYRLDGVGSIASWIAQGVMRTDRLEPQFMRLVDIRNVGPKLSSLLIRDVVYLYDLEEQVDPVDRLYVQPIDKWIRLIAPYVSEEPGIEEAADWILAGKISKYTRRAGLSGIRFNMGTTYFGAREVRASEEFDAAIDGLLEARVVRN